MIQGSEQTTEDHRKGVAYACCVALLFSGFVLVSRAGFATALTLPDIAVLRFGIGALLLLPVFIPRGFCGLRWRQAGMLAVLGGLGFALFAYAGFALAPAAHGAVFLHGTLSLTTAALLRWFGLQNDRAAPNSALAVIGIGIGIAAMAWDGASRMSLSLLLGDLCLILASLFWSGYGIYVRSLGLRAIDAAAIVAVVSAVIFLPFYLLSPGPMLLEVGWRPVLLQAAFQGVLIGVMSIFVYTRAVTLLGASKVSLFTAAVPGLTTLGGVVLLGEQPTVATLAGVALVTAGMVLTLYRLGRST